MYRVFYAPEFFEAYLKLDGQVQKFCDAVFVDLLTHPHGKPLRYNWFRERKFGTYRLYFLIYEEYSAVLVVAIGTKKEQRQTIDFILDNLLIFREWIQHQL